MDKGTHHMVEQKKKKSVSIHRSFLIVLILAAFALGIFVDRGFMLVTGSQPEERTERLAAPGGETIGQLRTGKELASFRSQVNDLVARALASKEVSSVSVYFLDLKSGNRFGINEDEKFAPHNLLKLPLMIAYFKRAETDPEVLRAKLVYAGGSARGAEHRIKTPRPLEPGKTYSVGDLIYRMVVFGDDDALALLSANLPASSLDRIYSDLGLDVDPADEEDSMTLSSYASFYRVLYNASYLNRRMSDKALSYLSKSTFRDGIVAGVPPNVTVASRFGELTFPVDEGERKRDQTQLHEIGIVLYPNRPYLLGVMVRGDDFTKLTRTMRDISRFVYREVEQQKERTP
jgi:beta-lactamase class A